MDVNFKEDHMNTEIVFQSSKFQLELKESASFLYRLLHEERLEDRRSSASWIFWICYFLPTFIERPSYK